MDETRVYIFLASFCFGWLAYRAGVGYGYKNGYVDGIKTGHNNAMESLEKYYDIKD